MSTAPISSPLADAEKEAAGAALQAPCRPLTDYQTGALERGRLELPQRAPAARRAGVDRQALRRRRRRAVGEGSLDVAGTAGMTATGGAQRSSTDSAPSLASGRERMVPVPECDTVFAPLATCTTRLQVPRASRAGSAIRSLFTSASTAGASTGSCRPASIYCCAFPTGAACTPICIWTGRGTSTGRGHGGGYRRMTRVSYSRCRTWLLPGSGSTTCDYCPHATSGVWSGTRTGPALTRMGPDESRYRREPVGRGR